MSQPLDDLLAPNDAIPARRRTGKPGRRAIYRDLVQSGIRVEPMPPPLPPRTRRLTNISAQDRVNAISSQEACALLRKLPSELRLMVIMHVFGLENVLLRLEHLLPGERLKHDLTETCGVTEHWKDSATASAFWPADTGEPRFGSFLAILMTCKALYDDGIDALYSTRNFLFSDPYSLMCFHSRIVPPRMQHVKVLVLKWEINALSIFEAHPKQQATWDELWCTIASFPSLRRLGVNVAELNPCRPEHWTRDLQWLEPIRRVTMPTEFEIVIPVNVPTLDVDTSPSSAKILGHPCFSAAPFVSPNGWYHFNAVKDRIP